MNFLEEFAAEWYGFNGYFTRTNINFGKRERGGWTGEIDVLAYRPSTGELIHIEISGSAESLARQRERFLNKKFIVSGKIYSEIAGGGEKRDVHKYIKNCGGGMTYLYIYERPSSMLVCYIYERPSSMSKMPILILKTAISGTLIQIFQDDSLARPH